MPNSPVILTIVSSDRPGIIEPLSEILASHNGDWVDSNMSSLAGKFAGVLLASVPDENVDSLITDWKRLSSADLHLLAEKAVASPEATGRLFTMELLGQDHPGIVRDITRVLSEHQVNIEKLVTERQDASMSGETMFFAKIRLRIPENTDLNVLQEALEKLANELMVDIDFEG